MPGGLSYLEYILEETGEDILVLGIDISRFLTLCKERRYRPNLSEMRAIVESFT